MTLRFASITVLVATLFAMFAGCGASGRSADGSGGPGGGSGPTGSGGASQNAGGSVNVDIDGSSSGGSIGNVCAGELSTAELIPLDIYIMLDASASMTEPAGANANESKWTAVVRALTEFLQDDASAGIGVGIQYFPQRKPDVPDSCTAHAQCGTSGPCFFKMCWNYPGLVACNNNGDCGGLYGPCMQFGVCANDATYVCQPIGNMCGDDENGTPLGACVATPYYCTATARCEATAYSEPAVPIALLPDASATLVTSIEGYQLKPDSATPTGPALQGAIDHARSWANANPTHRVVALLATDGLPTECTPVDIADVAAIAADGATGAPAISTFVIGVIGQDDVEGTTNLNAIALSGGTESAHIVDPSGDVTQDFLAALAVIRGTKLACEFSMPEADPGETLDTGLVNVQFTSDGESSRLGYVESIAGCDPASGGWYYDDPANPSKIIACPASCQSFEGAVNGSVQIEVGCQTIVQ